MIETVVSVVTQPLKDSFGNGRFRINLDGDHDIWAEEGQRPESVSLGIGIRPLVPCPGIGDNIESLYCDACGQKVNIAPGPIAPHEATPEAIEAYELDVQFGAIYLDINRDEIKALQARLQEVIDANFWDDDTAPFRPTPEEAAAFLADHEERRRRSPYVTQEATPGFPPQDS